MAPRSHNSSEDQGCSPKDDTIICGDYEQRKAEFLLSRRKKNLVYNYQRGQQAVYRERYALIRQQNAKARGEAAIIRLLQSKAAEHKDKAVELEVLGDLFYVRVSELQGQCSTSTSDQYALECDNLKNTIDALNSQLDQHLITSQEIILEAKERQLREGLRQQQVLKAIRDFEDTGHLSVERNGVNERTKYFRTAIGNQLKYHAQALEEWALMQEIEADDQEEQGNKRLVDKEVLSEI